MEETRRSPDFIAATEIKLEPPEFLVDTPGCEELEISQIKDEHFDMDCAENNLITSVDGIKVEPPDLDSAELESDNAELESESFELESESSELESKSAQLENDESGDEGREVKVEKVSFIADGFTENKADDSKKTKRTLKRPIISNSSQKLCEASEVQQKVYRSASEFKSKNCSICGVRCLNMDFYKLHMMHHERVNKCKKCHLLFESAAILTEHSKNCEVKRSEIYRCKDCQVVYTTRKGLEHHMRYCKKGVPAKKKQTRKKSYNVEGNQIVEYTHPNARILEINVNKCQVCQKKFMFLSSLEKHRLVCGKQSTAVSILENHDESSTDLSKNVITITTEESCSNNDKNEKTLYKCTECDEVFTETSRLKLHMKGSHTLNKQELENLAYRLTYERNEKTLYKCTECEEAFVEIDSLKLHTRRNHILNKPDFESLMSRLDTVKTHTLNKQEMEGLAYRQKYNRNEHTLYKCTECDEVFTETSRLKFHMKQGHPVNTNKLDIIEYPSSHSPNHADNVNRCLVCMKKFRFLNSLQKHSLVCGNHISVGSSLENQDKTSADLSEDFTPMAINSTDMLENKEESNSDNEITEETLYKCTECDEVFAGIISLKGHMKSHTELHLAVNEKKRRKESSNGKMHSGLASKGRQRSDKEQDKVKLIAKKNRTPGHVCKECGKVFEDLSCLISHRLGHSKTKLMNQKSRAYVEGSETPVECHKCGRIFDNRRRLKHHMVKAHSKKPSAISHTCTECGQVFNKLSCLVVHMKSHSDDRNLRQIQQKGAVLHTCTECSQVFNELRDLIEHLKSHTSRNYSRIPQHGAVSHTCKECGLVFHELRGLITHMKNHDSIFISQDRIFNNQKRVQQNGAYKCQDCGDGFADSNSLEIHAKTHVNNGNQSDGLQGTKCHMCNKLFQDSTGLKYHMRCVHGVRDYRQYEVKGVSDVIECEVCGLTTNSPAGMKIHMKVLHSKPKKQSLEKKKRKNKPRLELDECLETYQCLEPYHDESAVMKCEVCGLTTTSPAGMKIHMNVKHGGEQSTLGVKTEEG